MAVITDCRERQQVKLILEERLRIAHRDRESATDGVERRAAMARIDELLDLYVPLLGVKKE